MSLSFVKEKASVLVSQISKFHQFLYEAAVLDQARVSVPVISVGNLTFGGTGKTPFVDFLVGELKSLGIPCAVISRSYKAQVSEPLKVDPLLKESAQLFGDEPTWLAQRNLEVPVVVGRFKYQSAIHAAATTNAKVLVVDDGFQHRALHRDLDIVLLDATQSVQDLKVFPAGKAREDLQALKRASFVVITKCNLVDPKKVQELESFLPKNLAVFKMNYFTQLKLDFKSDESEVPSALLVSALGNPDSLEASLQKLPVEIVFHLKYPDHFHYSKAAIEEIERQSQSDFIDFILTTEKDFTKLNKHVFSKRLITLSQSLSWDGARPESFYEFLSKQSF